MNQKLRFLIAPQPIGQIHSLTEALNQALVLDCSEQQSLGSHMQLSPIVSPYFNTILQFHTRFHNQVSSLYTTSMQLYLVRSPFIIYKISCYRADLF